VLVARSYRRRPKYRYRNINISITENFVQYWQFSTEFPVPRMAHRSVHGALWWSFDSISAIFVFEASNVPWKLETEKTGAVNYTVENTLYLVYRKRQSVLNVMKNKR
jgi:hypothetical protein